MNDNVEKSVYDLAFINIFNLVNTVIMILFVIVLLYRMIRKKSILHVFKYTDKI